MLKDPYALEGAALVDVIDPDHTADPRMFARLQTRGIGLLGSTKDHHVKVGLMLIGLGIEGQRRRRHV
jgi:hypothetical protein